MHAAFPMAALISSLMAAVLAVACGGRSSLYVSDQTDGSATADGALTDGTDTSDSEAVDSAPDAAPGDAMDDLGIASDVAQEAPALDGGPDAGPDCGDACAPPILAAPRPVAPLSTSTVTSQQPRLHWELDPGSDGAQVEICHDRACTQPVATFLAPGTSALPPATLPPGVYFWRLRGTSNGVVHVATNPTWERRSRRLHRRPRLRPHRSRHRPHARIRTAPGLRAGREPRPRSRPSGIAFRHRPDRGRKLRRPHPTGRQLPERDLMRKPVMAGNWKMYKTPAETTQFFEKFRPLVEKASHCGVVICPPFTNLFAAVNAAKGSSIRIGAQNIAWAKEGAFTGEISGPMIQSTGATYAIVGHSERRQYFGETDQTVLDRTKAALSFSLTPIVCVGERLEEREAGKTADVLATQFQKGIAPLQPGQFASIVIAYEPVWAIGTGKTATPEIAADAHRTIRAQAESAFGKEAADAIRILYGGSVKPDNVKSLMAQPEIDGVLVGGASLDPNSFASIVNF